MIRSYEEQREHAKFAVRYAMMIAMDGTNAATIYVTSENLSGWFDSANVQEMMLGGRAYWHGGAGQGWKAFAFTTTDDKQAGLMLYPATSEQPRPYPASLAALGLSDEQAVAQ